MTSGSRPTESQYVSNVKRLDSKRLSDRPSDARGNNQQLHHIGSEPVCERADSECSQSDFGAGADTDNLSGNPSSARIDLERRDVRVRGGFDQSRQASSAVVVLTEPLNDKNFLLYCARHYDNPSCVDQEEFRDDLKRIKYIKKCISRYITTGDLKERLILNHLTVLYNVFGAEHLPRILYLKMREQFMFIRPFLEVLGAWPSQVANVGRERVANLQQIHADLTITGRLQNLLWREVL